MNEYINSLEENIMESTKNIDDIIASLKGIKGNLLSVGTGGSRVVAEYASKVLSKKNKLLAKTIDPRDLEYIDKSLFKTIFISSYSGSNYGVKNSLENDLDKYLLTNRKTSISDEKILHYEMPKEHSFISLSATIVPMAILLKYYLDVDFAKTIKNIFSSIDEGVLLPFNGEYINIFSGVDTCASESFIESTLTESGIAVPLIHEKYSYCHGRTTINKDKTHSAIYIGYKGTDLDIALKEVLEEQMDNLCILEDKYNDNIINDFYLTIQSIYLLRNIAESKNIDLSEIDYDKSAVKKLYYFQGSM